jgi:hypothetical protein
MTSLLAPGVHQQETKAARIRLIAAYRVMASIVAGSSIWLRRVHSANPHVLDSLRFSRVPSQSIDAQ